jgi:rhamnosyltransferase subunit B
MIAGELVYAAPLVAESLRIRWVSNILSPYSFFSSNDPSVMVNAPSLIHLRKGGASLYRLGLNIGRLATRHWSNPVRRLRREAGLTTRCDPVFRDKFSPDLVLALFSPLLAAKQKDWPSQTLVPGFVFLDQTGEQDRLPPRLEAFLNAGTPPLVFTQGSTAVHHAGGFFAVSAEVARRLNRRTVLLGIKDGSAFESADIVTLPYASYSRIFPRAAVNVHQWVSKAFEGAWETALIRIELPNADRLNCLQALNRMNINHLSLFPDLSGASRSTNLRLEIMHQQL